MLYVIYVSVLCVKQKNMEMREFIISNCVYVFGVVVDRCSFSHRN